VYGQRCRILCSWGVLNIETVLSRAVAGHGVLVGKEIYWTHPLVTTDNYDRITELHTPEIAVTTEHIKSSRSLLAVAW
jgi:hypothetical protein